MAIDVSRVRRHLQHFDFKSLFIEELGWDRCVLEQTIWVGETTYTLCAVAEKRGLVAFLFQGERGVDLPDYPTRRRIEKEIAKAVHEHIVIYTDAAHSTQVWQWVKREPNKPAACREHRYYQGQSGEALIQKLDPLVVTLEEEDRDDLTIAEIARRVRTGLDVEKVTRRFYDRFKKEHEVFRTFIKGISIITDLNWYASIMLNRLMFIYFVQKKGFLDEDRDYLRNRLKQMWQQKGKGKFYTFYRYFLIRLFHEGLGQQEEKRDPELENLLGHIPYLNGGLFDVHQLEKDYPEIQIPDEAFERLFDFFDAYQWHLDEHPLRADNEINPDVLGYIFEKYINQKQMGAYYTKEDITEYISRNTIVPFLFDAAKKGCRIAFEGEQSVWNLLETDPDRYIFPAVSHGIVWDARQTPPQRLKKPYELPAEIEEGIDTTRPNLLERRKPWNTPAPATHALPTEIWREVVARRQRYAEVRAKLVSGEIREINDLITYNLDIRQFAQDVIESCEGPELLRAFWKELESVTILDPTCGSGAFLFAALNILEPLYQAALDRMQFFVDELEHSDQKHSPQKYGDFRQTLRELHEHPNERYFILKKIILNNLYGVDLMDEAVEICKLRLFLKLAAQVEPDYAKANLGLEPLPDIDFNIRAGNTLVGFTSMDDVRRAVEGDFIKELALPAIKEKAEAAERSFTLFRQQQTEPGGEVTHEDKENLRSRLRELDDELNQYLASEYGVDHRKPDPYGAWLESHKPFHWFVEFYGIMKRSGFDVIIGNPPYVELSVVTNEYSIRNLSLTTTGNLCSLCLERCIQIVKRFGAFGIIVPISSVSTPRMISLMEYLQSHINPLYVSNFAVRPGKLFVGVDMNLSILVGRQSEFNRQERTVVYSTTYNRWNTDMRSFLFPSLVYKESLVERDLAAIPKISHILESNIIHKLFQHAELLDHQTISKDRDTLYYHSGGRYFRKCLRKCLSNEYKPLYLENGWAKSVQCLLSSSLYYWFWIVFSDTYHVTKNDVWHMPTPSTLVQDKQLLQLADILLKHLWMNSETRIRNRADGSIQKEVNFYVGRSKHIIDRIDKILSKHYNLTDEELDFIINYDIKYRMGISE